MSQAMCKLCLGLIISQRMAIPAQEHLRYAKRVEHFSTLPMSLFYTYDEYLHESRHTKEYSPNLFLKIQDFGTTKFFGSGMFCECCGIVWQGCDTREKHGTEGGRSHIGLSDRSSTSCKAEHGGGQVNVNKNFGGLIISIKFNNTYNLCPFSRSVFPSSFALIISSIFRLSNYYERDPS